VASDSTHPGPPLTPSSDKGTRIKIGPNLSNFAVFNAKELTKWHYHSFCRLPFLLQFRSRLERRRLDHQLWVVSPARPLRARSKETSAAPICRGFSHSSEDLQMSRLRQNERSCNRPSCNHQYTRLAISRSNPFVAALIGLRFWNKHLSPSQRKPRSTIRERTEIYYGSSHIF